MGKLRQKLCRGLGHALTLGFGVVGIASGYFALNGSVMATGLVCGLALSFVHDPIKETLFALQHSSVELAEQRMQITNAFDEMDDMETEDE